MTKKWILRSLCLPFLLAFLSCDNFEPAVPEASELLDGPVAGLSPAETRIFLAGDIAFNDVVFNSENGLGPLFVATSCASCHAGDGKGHPFTTLTRFGQAAPGQNLFLELGGPQLQNRAIPGFTPEKMPPGASFSKFVPPANTGLGFLQLVPDADLLDLADPDDLDGDGISGTPHWGVLPEFLAPRPNAISRDGKYIHRFGKKAAAYDLLHQTVNAYSQDIGITSLYSDIDLYSGLNTEPEIDINTINSVVFYLQTLKAPVPRKPDDPAVIAGQALFDQIQCSACHIPTLRTGPSVIPALSEKVFHPYTDLLLHDMGPGLDDGYTEGNAETYEWRTPPLWGLGLSPNSQGGEFFLMHDGRAHSIEEAILLHGGEGGDSKSAFMSLSSREKEDLLTFLRAL